MPTKKAHGIQIAKMCEAFKKNGVECELVVPKMFLDPTVKEGNIVKFYNINPPPKVTRLWSLDLVYLNAGSFLNKFLFWVQQLSFAYSVKRYIGDRHSVIYSRDQFTLYAMKDSKSRLFWEAHKFPQNINSKFYSRLFKKLTGLVVITSALKRDFSFHFNNILVASDAVDLGQFDVNITKKEARDMLGLPQEKHIAVYAGQLYDWKGADILSRLPEYINKNSVIVVIGGIKKDIERLKAKVSTGLRDMVIFKGHVDHDKVSIYLKASDCVLLTGKESSSVSREYTSPLKMFEYMASRRPIVAPKLPSFTEILNHHNSVLVKPNDSRDFADGINKIFSEPSFGETIANNAFDDSKEKTWIRRAKNIYEFIQSHCSQKKIA
jgi:glycosyltransferase involved in cell wall biosynthesis